MLFRVKAFKLVYVMHKPFVKSRRMKTPFAFLLFIANLYERRNPLHAQPDLVVYSLRLSPVWLSLLYLQLSGLTNFLLNHSFTFLWYMYTPSRKTLWSFSLTLVACSMFAAVCATPSREGPDTTISSPSTLTFVLSPTIFAILGDLSP